MSRHEQQVNPEIDEALAAAFAAAFIPRRDRYPRQNADGSYTAVKQPLTLPLIEAHTLGKVTIGAYALDVHNRARWLCFDADDLQEWDGLHTLAVQLAEQSIPSYLEPSRRGGHLWLFFSNLYPGRDARRFGKQLLAEHNLETVELYPKQDELRTGPGSLVRLPLGVHRKDGHRYHFITTDGQPLAPTIREQMALLAHPQRLPQTFVAEVLARAPETPRLSPTPHFESQSEIAGETVSERIKNAVSVYDFVSQYVQLDRGSKGLCPFHDDHRESFGVNQDGNFWNCFSGCGGGSVIDFYMKWRGIDFNEAVKELADMLL
jgi:hypothetical protein